MVLLKCFVIFALFFYCQATGKNDENNIRECPDAQPSWKTLVNEPVYVEGKFLQVQKYIFKYPKEGISEAIIKCILVTDKTNDGTGAYPRVAAGGLGSRFIEIEFTSQRSRSINSNVELLGE